MALHCIALHCIALHCIALYCIVLYCVVLYCIVLYCSRVRRLCASCDICQRTVKKSSVYKAPLHSVPVVGNPFEKVAIDHIGGF